MLLNMWCERLGWPSGFYLISKDGISIWSRNLYCFNLAGRNYMTPTMPKPRVWWVAGLWRKTTTIALRRRRKWTDGESGSFHQVNAFVKLRSGKVCRQSRWIPARSPLRLPEKKIYEKTSQESLLGISHKLICQRKRLSLDFLRCMREEFVPILLIYSILMNNDASRK